MLLTLVAGAADPRERLTPPSDTGSAATAGAAAVRTARAQASTESDGWALCFSN
jgi:hypothetical protein